MSDVLKCVTPADGSIYAERPLAGLDEIETTIARSRAAQAIWALAPTEERAALCSRFTDAFVGARDRIAEELSWQMGRPIAHSPGEIRGVEERARYMISIAAEALAPIDSGPKEGFRRYIKREPLGIVLTIAPWNYPYLTAINSIVPAIMAGNAVILKPSAQTPLTAERLADAFAEAGLPEGVFQYLFLSHRATDALIEHPGVDFVNFTGSVAAGHAVQEAAARRFIGIGLELGGKDPAYVRADADLGHAVENLVDGAFFNAGQSCCGIERIYVHQNAYDDFVAGFADLTRRYRLGHPLDKETTLGPVVRPAAAEFIRGQIADALKDGASALIDPVDFAADTGDSCYLAPQVMVDVDHSMRIMTEESFGPVVGIMKVASDEEAVRLMNDSEFGLTASIWTADVEAAVAVGDRVETGTWFMNRCDYLDPSLAWTGVKNSGRGCTLSRIGYEHLTRPKSYHLRTGV